MNVFKYSPRGHNSKIFHEYKRQLNVVHNTMYNSMYSNCIQNPDFAGCTYGNANNPDSGRCKLNVGDFAPASVNSGTCNWKQDVSLNSNCAVNQKYVAVSSQHYDTIIREVQPRHQCPYSDQANTQKCMNTNVLSLCTVMFTNKYWHNTAKGCISHLVFISNEENLKKFCVWNIFDGSGVVQITDCTDVEVGFSEIIHTSVVPVLFDKPFNADVDPKLTYVKGQSWGFTSRSTARVILGQVLRIATCGTRTHRGDSL